MAFARVLCLLALCVVLTNCAGPSSYLTGVSEQRKPVDIAFWTNYRVGHRHVARTAATPRVSLARNLPGRTTGRAFGDTHASVDVAPSPVQAPIGANAPKVIGQDQHPVKWFTPELQAQEKAEDDRLKRVTNICRRC